MWRHGTTVVARGGSWLHGSAEDASRQTSCGIVVGEMNIRVKSLPRPLWARVATASNRILYNTSIHRRKRAAPKYSKIAPLK